MKNKKRSQHIILSTCSTNPRLNYFRKEQPILFFENGDISCGILTYKYKTYHRTRDQYSFIYKYLKKHRLSLNITNIIEKDLGDIIEELQSIKKKSISLKKLMDIYCYKNQIAGIKTYKIRLIEQYADKVIWKKYQILLETNHKEAMEMKKFL
ncbi:hypothetical protein AUK04_03985 [Candidatus Roizmanbacteria bacterium CG2_30_33_16]|uniref:Uncharacterized protein n=5 Tax=Candidatus Roizmaniibacteriota TaxID=1752723 RepID=A0A2M7E4J6_9BACT|nr:hypothetical protein [Candidatus Roizmanbacteria bacterium]OIP82951.1 MAG: hypothetical protein AUK04_03985 [Candidatus Roizmanbacteria bacterium CG2_30_33_16]PIP64211.1 MAG: hypothetical protein COW96_03815 [Candidatus Roizmanbacteria bacterium CG22_combo_CG10-13_8_21_14_all_33_16]PIV62633.1 MAG: hypothetical protein COS12_01640 [Candidatus Roizmanbacteria bacterium CG01_land_8_20_14_3_00_33_9]PIX71756.1 MAG: hypothetical protein COZ39_03550 [Candidatus Roizmanbacteria bacterium CG_4_10_14_